MLSRIIDFHSPSKVPVQTASALIYLLYSILLMLMLIQTNYYGTAIKH